MDDRWNHIFIANTGYVITQVSILKMHFKEKISEMMPFLTSVFLNKQQINFTSKLHSLAPSCKNNHFLIPMTTYDSDKKLSLAEEVWLQYCYLHVTCYNALHYFCEIDCNLFCRNLYVDVSKCPMPCHECCSLLHSNVIILIIKINIHVFVLVMTSMFT